MLFQKKEMVVGKEVEVLRASNVRCTQFKVYKTQELQKFLRTTYYLLFVPVFRHEKRIEE